VDIMATQITLEVEAHVSTLMNVVDEELWREEGLFDNY